jgi:subtilisin family serine protease
VTVLGHTLAGVGRVRAIATGDRIYGGVISERPLGGLPAADLNGDGNDTDTLVVVVARASDGWVLFADTDGDGSLANERPVHDFLVARETFAWHTGARPAGLNLAVNFREVGGNPELDLFFDTSAHGSHVAGIAAGHDIYGVAGFDGVAPGAYLLGLKIANNAQGGISTSGSMERALAYAIAFAAQRRLPLVLNMSFGVGNEAEGQARIDRVIDSILTRNPGLVFTISAGNDGPGLSTMGFPGSATRALTVGATFPGVFLGAPIGTGEPVAYFSSRGGELAKPDLITPGMAYSTVPRWNTGDERKGGTSMASPHAAGLVAILLSGLAQAGRPIEARQVRQALMVTARPVPDASYLDEGTGLPDVGSAWRWLAAGHSVPEVSVRALTNGVTAAWRGAGLAAPGDTLQDFSLELPGGATPVETALRSSVDWIHAPARVTLQPGKNTLRLTYRGDRFAAPGVYTGTVTGWTSDTLAGPAFRLVNTVITPDTGSSILASLGDLPAGGLGRVTFRAESGRPFAVAVGTQLAGEQVLAYLHEPGGQPYREDNGLGAGSGDDAAVFLVDARDVVPGFYEAVAVAPPLQGASATIVVRQSPLLIDARREGAAISLTLTNVSRDTVRSEPFAVVVGAERTQRVIAQGSGVQRMPFTLPPWAVHATVDVSMDPAQWPRFTDFGVTLFSADGRQLGKSPLNYAFGRLHVDLPETEDRPAGSGASVALVPGLADSSSGDRWTADLSLRLYADSADVTRLEGAPVTLPPGRRVSLAIPLPATSLPLGVGFFPLAIVVVPEGERTWTREVPLPPNPGPLMP